MKEIWPNYMVAYAVVVGVLLTTVLLIFGLVFFLKAGTGPNTTPKKTIFTRYLGLFFITMGIWIAFGTLAIYVNFAVWLLFLRGAMAIMGIVAISVLPDVMEEAVEQRKIEDAIKKMDKVEKDIAAVKEWGNKILPDGN